MEINDTEPPEGRQTEKARVPGGRGSRELLVGALLHQRRPVLSFGVAVLTTLGLLGLRAASARQDAAPWHGPVNTQNLQTHKALVEGLPVATVEPSVNELRAWFLKNQELFRRPPTISFRQLYFSTKVNGSSSRDTALQVLQEVSREPDSPAASLADSSRHYYKHWSRRQLARVFGQRFARSLFLEHPGRWRGPMESDSGWHLVWIDSIEPGRVPPFESIVAEVRVRWVVERRAAFVVNTFEPNAAPVSTCFRPVLIPAGYAHRRRPYPA